MANNKVKSIKLRGKRFKLTKSGSISSDTRGFCTDVTEPHRRICLDSKLQGEEELEVYIHEFLHACFWDMDESAIEEAGEDIARALWRLGYRKEEKAKE
jgi:hypothetical protein